MNVVDRGKNNYSKILEINDKDEEKLTKWEDKYFEDSREMDEYNKDATFREYGYMTDNSNTEFDFGNPDIDYSDYVEHDLYDVTNNIAKQGNTDKQSNSKNIENEVDTGKQGFRGFRRRQNKTYNPTDEAADNNGLVNDSTNGFGKPFKSKYKVDNLSNALETEKLFRMIKSRLTYLSDQYKKLVAHLNDRKTKEQDRDISEEYKQKFEKLIMSIRKTMINLSKKVSNEANDKVLQNVDLGINKLIESSALAKANIAKGMESLESALTILKEVNIGKDINIENSIIQNTNELTKQTTHLVIMLKILLFIILIVVFALIVKYLTRLNKSTGEGDQQPIWLHSNPA